MTTVPTYRICFPKLTRRQRLGDWLRWGLPDWWSFVVVSWLTSQPRRLWDWFWREQYSPAYLLTFCLFMALIRSLGWPW